MNIVDFQEKMDPAHRESLCRMLNVKELPEDLLVQYIRVKRMTDRIDAFLTAGDLAMIAVIVGIDEPETIAAQDVAEDKEAEEILGPAEEIIESAVGESVEQSVYGVAGQAQPELSETPVIKDEQATAPAKPQTPAGILTGHDPEPETDEAKAKAETLPAASRQMWSIGMPVNVLQADELKRGKIVGIILPKHSYAALQLTVEFEDGETVTVEENEVEAI